MKGPSWKLYGIDMENSTAEKARSATGAEVFVGDVMDAPFPPDSFDVITAFDLLEHVYQPRQFLTKVLDWLKPGGIFCTMLPNIDSWESRIFGSYWYGLEMPRHLFHFSPKSLKQVMVTLGFEQVVLSTSEISYVERSMGYVCSKVMENAGFAQVSAAQGKQQSIPWRAVRKAMRITLVRPAGHLASLAGAGASLEAIFNTLPLAGSDITLPMELGVGDTLLSLLLPQQLGSLLDETVFDPNTGIIAGLLNARDDLATAVLTANNDFPSALGSLATAEWANMPELIQATGSTLLTDLAALFNPADFFAA